MSSTRTLNFIVASCLSLQLSACAPNADVSNATEPAPVSPFILTASIQDIMVAIIDPAADFIWDSVGIVSTADGVEHHRPATDGQWLELRHKAIIIMEASNLLAMEGRSVVEEGTNLKAEVLEGDLSPAQIQTLLNDDYQNFTAFAFGLHEAAAEALQAIDAKDVDALLDAGGNIDLACEYCHLTYWYPQQ